MLLIRRSRSALVLIKVNELVLLSLSLSLGRAFNYSFPLIKLILALLFVLRWNICFALCAF